MFETFRISFSLKNTYGVNAVLYAVRQIPLIRRLVPASLYGVHGIKIAANVLVVLWQILSVFAGKVLYLLAMVTGPAGLYEGQNPAPLFAHILFFLTLIGAVMNTYLFNPTNDKYYAVLLMRMDARRFALTDYAYNIGRVLVGFYPLVFAFGLPAGVPVLACALTPLLIAGAKLCMAAFYLRRYEKKGVCTNENLPARVVWVLIAVLLAAAYGLPAAGIVMPLWLFAVFGVLAAMLGGVSCVYLARFSAYRPMYQQLLSSRRGSMDLRQTAANATRESSRRMISAETVVSRKKGFEYFNELFVRRHKRVLWASSQKIAAVSAFAVAGLLLAFRLSPVVAEATNEVLLTFLPYFVFILYSINRGVVFTQALFANCDHCMLTYPFYKKPSSILRLFCIRLRELVKINLLPAGVIAAGLPLLLYASGGTENWVEYPILAVSILAMSVFFSVHYLVLYYLLQPYNAATQVKSGTYRLAAAVTYLVCFVCIKVRMEIVAFGVGTIAFALLYCAAALVLVYKLAPRTFRIRN